MNTKTTFKTQKEKKESEHFEGTIFKLTKYFHMFYNLMFKNVKLFGYFHQLEFIQIAYNSTNVTNTEQSC